QNAYHIALEVRTEEKGDSAGTGRGAIEEAATQICRGLNGFVRFIARSPQVLGKHKGADFLPVIFTTARLWTTDADLSLADVNNGNIDLTKSGFQEQSWVVLQYHMSPGLKHAFLPKEQPTELSDLMETEFIRTIPIVNSSAIASFLAWASNIDLF